MDEPKQFSQPTLPLALIVRFPSTIHPELHPSIQATFNLQLGLSAECKTTFPLTPSLQ